MRQRRAINKKFSSQNHELKAGLLYKLVFCSVSSRLFVTFLFFTFLLQPVSFVYASEEESLPDSTSLAEAIDLVAAPPSLSLPDNDQTIDNPEEELQVLEPLPEDSNDLLETAEVSASTTLPEPIAEEETTLPVISTTTPETTTADEIIEPDTSTSSASSTTISLSTTTETNLDQGLEVEDLPVNQLETADELATTSDEVIATTTEEIVEDTVLQIEHNSSNFQFNKEECTSVGEGSFYCSKNDQAPESKPDGVFAAPDAGGDMEIYIRVNNVEQQLTQNNIDDQAPYYDAYSQRIVWHANYNDRYQIMSYSFTDGKTIQLTNETYNNMEPVAYDKVTLWQAWINNNWEIMSFDGQTVTQLTSNGFHDVSPHMRDNFIIWQSQFAEGWKVSIFDTKTGRTEYLDAEAGTKLENPRFVLVYDSTSESGDIQTLGYDPNKKQSFTIGSLPEELPEELPEPDNTGETRALIQSKPSHKAVEIEETEPLTPTSSSTPPDLDLPTLDLSSSTATSSEVLSPAAEPPVATTTSSYSHIPDLVIPPVATSTPS